MSRELFDDISRMYVYYIRTYVNVHIHPRYDAYHRRLIDIEGYVPLHIAMNFFLTVD